MIVPSIVWFDSRTRRRRHRSVACRRWRAFQATAHHARDRRQATTRNVAIVNRPRVTSFARWCRHRGPTGHVTARRMTTLTSTTASRYQGNRFSIFRIFVATENLTQSNEFIEEFKGISFKMFKIALFCRLEKSSFYRYRTSLQWLFLFRLILNESLKRRYECCDSVQSFHHFYKLHLIGTKNVQINIPRTSM